MDDSLLICHLNRNIMGMTLTQHYKVKWNPYIVKSGCVPTKYCYQNTLLLLFNHLLNHRVPILFDHVHLIFSPSAFKLNKLN